MKAYRQEDGTVRLFRPDMNMKRMNNVGRLLLPEWIYIISGLQSAARLALPVRHQHLLQKPQD